MTNSWIRKSMAVIAFAAGVAMFGGGVAQASETAGTETVPVVEGGSVDQDATNVCGNVKAKDSIVFNFAWCGASNTIVDGDFDHHHQLSDLKTLGNMVK